MIEIPTLMRAAIFAHPDVVRTALHQNGMALEYASDELKDHPRIVLEAMVNRPDALRYASGEIQRNFDVPNDHTLVIENVIRAFAIHKHSVAPFQ